MAISPEDAARDNDLKIKKFIGDENARIDKILAEKYYTGILHVELPAPEYDVVGLDRLIMKQYNDKGWRIEVVKSNVWRFIPCPG